MPAALLGLLGYRCRHSCALAVGLVWGGNSGRAAVLPLRWMNTVAVAECPVSTHPGLGGRGEGPVLHGTRDVGAECGRGSDQSTSHVDNGERGRAGFERESACCGYLGGST